MTKRPTSKILLACLLFLVVGGAPAVPQDTDVERLFSWESFVEGASQTFLDVSSWLGRLLQRSAVHILPFEEKGQSPTYGPLADFVAVHVQARLKQDPKLGVRRSPRAPECRAWKPPATGDEERGSGVLPSTYSGKSFIVKGSIGYDQRQLSLAYEVSMTARCITETLVRDSLTFDESALLENLSVMADVVAFAIERREQDVTLIRVKIDGDPGLQEHLVGRLTFVDDLLALPGGAQGPEADLIVDGRVDLQGGLRLARLDLSVPGKDGRLAVPEVAETEAGESSFYSRVSDNLMVTLDRLHYARLAGVSEELFSGEGDLQLARAEELLCLGGAEAGCVPKPAAVVALLGDPPGTAERPDQANALLGVAYAGLGEHLRAALAFDRAVEMTVEDDMTLRNIALLDQAAGAWLRAGGANEAASRYRRALDLAVASEVFLGERPGPERFVDLAEIYFQSSDVDAAIETLLEGIALLPDDEVLSGALTDLIFSLEGPDRERVVGILERRELPTSDPLALALALRARDRQKSATSLDELRGSLDLARQALELSPESDRIRAEVLYSAGLSLYRLNELPEALEKLAEASELFADLDQLARQSEVLLAVGMANIYQARATGAGVGYFREALEIARRAEDPAAEAEALEHLGWAQLNTGETAAAIQSYNEALSIQDVLGNEAGQAEVLVSLGTAYWRQGNETQAQDHWEKGLRRHRAAGDRGGEAQSLSAIGTAYHRSGDLESARKLLEQAIAIHEELGNVAAADELRSYLGSVS